MDSNVISSMTQINVQLHSPLYDGTLPTEIRYMIFEHVLMPFVPDHSRHDFRITNHHDVDPDDDLTDEERLSIPHASQYRPAWEFHLTNTMDWLTPGYRGKEYVDTSLLRTCRRVYLEAQALIWKQEVCFWLYRGPGRHQRDWLGNSNGDEMQFAGGQGCEQMPILSRFFNSIPPHHANHIHHVHLFTEMSWLEDQFYRQLAGPCSPMRSVRHLRLTIRRGDWWDSETNAPLRIDPFRPRSEASVMEDLLSPLPLENTSGSRRDGGWFGAHSADDGNPWTQETKSWGLAFAHLTNLERLVMDFETSEDKKDELGRVVRWASRDWTFPLRSKRGDLLSAAGQPVRKKTWRGKPTHWSRVCPGCMYPKIYKQETRSECPQCERKLSLLTKGLGPRMFTWTVTWTARRDMSCDILGDDEIHVLLDKTPLIDRWPQEEPSRSVGCDPLLPTASPSLPTIDEVGVLESR